jgi:hypothetical protein
MGTHWLLIVEQRQRRRYNDCFVMSRTPPMREANDNHKTGKRVEPSVIIGRNPAGGFLVWVDEGEPPGDPSKRRAETIGHARYIARALSQQRRLQVEDRSGL